MHFHRIFQRTSERDRISSEGGFTLIEVLASVVILAILGSAVFLALQKVQTDTLDTGEYNQALGLATTIAEELRDNYTDGITEVPLPSDALSASHSSSDSSVIDIPVSTSTPPVATNFDGFKCSITTPSKDANGNPNYFIEVVDPNGRTATVTVDDPAILGAGG